MSQVTLISLYGQKPKELEKLISRCIECIQDSVLRTIFIPYNVHQIHGTLIGMEKLKGFTKHYNANAWAETGKKGVMEFANLLEIVKKHLPMTIRFGGFEKTSRPFYSLGKKPYDRSFQIQWQTNKLTLIGWPHENGDFTSIRPLEALRNDVAIHCNIQHKYKNDNDLFMVIGALKGLQSLTGSELEETRFSAANLEEKIRDHLANHNTELEIAPEQVFLARYSDEALPFDTTIPYCIANPGIDADFIRKLYS